MNVRAPMSTLFVSQPEFSMHTPLTYTNYLATLWLVGAGMEDTRGSGTIHISAKPPNTSRPVNAESRAAVHTSSYL